MVLSLKIKPALLILETVLAMFLNPHLQIDLGTRLA